MESAFITGVAGFLGSNLAELLLSLGWTVYGCDNFATSTESTIPDGVIFEQEDIREMDYIPEVQHVFHTAAIARSAWPDQREIYDVNINGTANILSLSRDIETHVVNCSSCVVETPHINTYAGSKRIAEDIATDDGAISLRFSNIYGRGQSQLGAEPNVLASWQLQRAKEGWIRVDGDGTQTRDFIHVRDAARALWYASEYRATDVMDICTGVQTRLIDIALQFNCGIRHAPRRDNDPDCFPQETRSAYEKLGFVSVIPLSLGIREII